MTDTANPKHYFRLLLLRLLETQTTLESCSNLPPSAHHQLSANAYTLSEIKSWLEEVGDNWEVSPSPLFALRVENSGPDVLPSCFPAGGPWKQAAQSALKDPLPGIQPAPSYQPSGSTPRAWVRSTNGRITFHQTSSGTKPPDTSGTSSIG